MLLALKSIDPTAGRQAGRHFVCMKSHCFLDSSIPKFASFIRQPFGKVGFAFLASLALECPFIFQSTCMTID